MTTTATTKMAVQTSGLRLDAMRGRIVPTIAILVVLSLWQLLATTVWADSYALPSPTAIVARAISDISFAWPHIIQTGWEASLGWFFGNLIALIAAIVFLLIKPLETFLFRLFVALYCLPLVAIAPILIAVLPSGWAQVVVSAQGVFFTTLIALMLGFRSADPVSLDVVRASGGGAASEMFLVRLTSALPSLFAGLRIAAPASVLGAVVGEYLGANRGLGIAMIYSQQSLDITRTWGLALDTALLAGLFYVITAVAERLVVPWMNHGALISLPIEKRIGSPLRRFGSGLGSLLISLVIILAVWQAVVTLSGLSSYFMKGPLDVFNYLFTSDAAGENLSRLGSALGITLQDTLLGYIAGTIAAIILAVLVTLSPTVAAIVTPFTITMRAVPLVALTPLFVLIFGRGIGVVLFIAGIVTLFPTLVTVTSAIARTPKVGLDLIRANGGGRWAEIRYIMLPTAVPAVFAAARTAAPTAMLGALLAEWLATGSGLGSDMLRAAADAQFGYVWSAVAAITLAALALYGLATIAETAFQRRLGN